MGPGAYGPSGPSTLVTKNLGTAPKDPITAASILITANRSPVAVDLTIAQSSLVSEEQGPGGPHVPSTLGRPSPVPFEGGWG